VLGSIPNAPTNILSIGMDLEKKEGGLGGQISPMIRFLREFSAARVTTGFQILSAQLSLAL
jgi:hypothetical protein